MTKPKKDPLHLVLSVTLIFLAIVVVAVAFYMVTGTNGIFQQNALLSEVQRINNENEEAQLQYQLDMQAAQQAAAQVVEPQAQTETVETALASWSQMLEGSSYVVRDLGDADLDNVHTATYQRSSLLNTGLLLVNPWHSRPEDFDETDLISIGTAEGSTIQVSDNTVRLFPVAYEALSEALAAAKEAGLEHYIVREGYRSLEDQAELFNARMEKLSSKYSGNQLIEKTKKEVNYPGTSDYNTGLSFRMDVYEKGNSELNDQKFQSESAQGAWLTENCWKYGIIFRFPTSNFPNSDWEDKSYITGVSSQLNIYRYVGKAHSTAMRVMGLCLEEYIDLLIEHPHLCIYVDGAAKYEIVRISDAGDRTSFTLPISNVASNVQVSLDNMDGVVIAYEY